MVQKKPQAEAWGWGGSPVDGGYPFAVTVTSFYGPITASVHLLLRWAIFVAIMGLALVPMDHPLRWPRVAPISASPRALEPLPVAPLAGRAWDCSVLMGRTHLPVFAQSLAAEPSRIRPRYFFRRASKMEHRRSTDSQEEAVQPFPGGAILPSRIGGQADPGYLSQPRDSVAIDLHVRGATPFFGFSHGPDFRIRLVAGSCLHRVSQHSQGSYWSSLPGFHLSRCQAGSLAFSPSLLRWIPFPRRGVGMLPLLRRFSGRLRLRFVFRLSVDFQG